MINLTDMTIEELKAFAEGIGEKAFRGKQIFAWLNKGVYEVDEMTDLSKASRQKLKRGIEAGDFAIKSCKVAGVQEDKKDSTKKFLFEVVSDGGVISYIESVFMKYKYGNSLCVSTQIGCRMGCKFCASTLDGLDRNLSAGEIIGQLMATEKYTGEEINHIVVMGMGEPFDNYENVAKALRILHDTNGKNMSYRNMTVSTSGIVPMIERFGDEFPQVNLAISLHRLTDSGRSAIMPINRKYPLDMLLEAAKNYTDKTHRRITFEYTLIEGENDSSKDMDLMVSKLRGLLCHVNLIPLNKVEETGFIGSSRNRAETIANALKQAGIAATVRRELGSEIDGACGQLRRKKQNFEIQ